jgi:ketosteroid isomerase-like protein
MVFVAPAFVLALLASSVLSAQELTPAQEEVWQAIEACQANFANENLDGALDCFHEDFSGWRYGDPVPRSKSTTAKFMPVDFQSTETLAFDLRPISIRVFGDFAVAHYFLATATRDHNGDILRERVQWTDVLIRQNGRWRWVADHGGPITNQP